jgi:hypothetical protein
MIDAITQSLMDELDITESEAIDKLKGWEILPVPSGDHTVGHLAKHGNEIHTALYPEYRMKPITAVIRMYKKLLKTEFFLTTRVQLHNQEAIDISERVGFREVRRDDTCVYYWMDETTVLGAKHAA